MIVWSARHRWSHSFHVTSRQSEFGRRQNQPIGQKRNHWLCPGKSLARCTGARPQRIENQMQGMKEMRINSRDQHQKEKLG